MILVTGSEGFIGKHVVAALEASGETVVGLDIREPTGAHWGIQGDIRAKERLDSVFRHNAFTTVIHLAARVGVRDSVTDPTGYVETNVLGSLNVLEACRQAGVEHIVMASTSSVYGNQTPMVETALSQPLSPYAASKVGMEALAQTYAHLYGMNIAVLRLFSVYGEGIRPDLMIYRIMDALVKGAPITLFDDGQLYRDWTYVADVVDALLRSRAVNGLEIINIGVGNPYSVRQIVDYLESVSGMHLQSQLVSAPATEPKKTNAIVGKAWRLLDWDATTPIWAGLDRTWAWFQQTVVPERA